MLSFALKRKVIRVSDGDTIVILDSTNTQHRIRLDGIDKELSELEQTAKDKKLNIWSEKNSIELYEWRKKKRK